jgi:hypothetical protein
MFALGHYRSSIFNETNLKWPTKDAQSDVEHLSEYRDWFHAFLKRQEDEAGDPEKAIKIMVDVVRGEGVATGMGEVDRLPIGKDAVDCMQPYCEKVLEGVKKWEKIVSNTGFDTT